MFATLRSLDGFAGFANEQLAQVAALAEVRAASPGEVLTRADEPRGSAFLVIEGNARMTICGAVVDTLGPGDFIGDVALADGDARCADVVALTPMALAAVDPRRFRSLVHDQPLFARLVAEASHRLRAPGRTAMA
ncbi:MAG: hypothetical protein NVS3B12_32350 [Acidimicrobiales bacterium]